MLPHVWNDIGNFCIWATAILLALALVMYTWIDRWGWARNWAGRVIAGLAVTIIVIYIPSLIALADPAFTGFGTRIWYQWVALGTVLFSFAVAMTMVGTLEYVRRVRKKIKTEGADHD